MCQGLAATTNSQQLRGRGYRSHACAPLAPSTHRLDGAGGNRTGTTVCCRSDRAVLILQAAQVGDGGAPVVRHEFRAGIRLHELHDRLDRTVLHRAPPPLVRIAKAVLQDIAQEAQALLSNHFVEDRRVIAQPSHDGAQSYAAHVLTHSKVAAIGAACPLRK
eukprot:scaffold19141_cov66-Phaeocystis_antarctica.AAC.2